MFNQIKGFLGCFKGGYIPCQKEFLVRFCLDLHSYSVQQGYLVYHLCLGLINIACFAHSRRDSWPVPRWWSGEHHWQREAGGPSVRIDGYKRKLLEVLHRPGSETAQGETLWDYCRRECCLCFFFAWHFEANRPGKSSSQWFSLGEDICY